MVQFIPIREVLLKVTEDASGEVNRKNKKYSNKIMEKKYSVFVSSTYTDLQEERKKVIDALLQMNCFPIGMEYFNAEDDTQWNIIKNLINECDYYTFSYLISYFLETCQ